MPLAPRPGMSASFLSKPEFIIGTTVLGLMAWRAVWIDPVVLSAHETRSPKLKPTLSAEHNMGFESVFEADPRPVATLDPISNQIRFEPQMS